MNMLTERSPLSKGSNLEKSVVISLENISVSYRVPRERVSGIKEFTIRLIQRRLEYEEFLALDSVSFQVNRGETFGVVGRNGSGKSTLLKVIARVLHPNRGRVITLGKIAPLLELGAGFQSELTGRENIYLYSALLGRSKKETDLLFPSIIDFAGIGEFIEAPIRTYSTGMVARLGFSVATCIRPDILLIDEVLSVGDGKFQEKCLDRMYSFQKEGTTIIIVSHSLATIEAFCDRAVWLDTGCMQAIGDVEKVIGHYVQMEKTGSIASQDQAKQPREFELDEHQIEENIKQYIPLNDLGSTYPTINNLNLMKGSVSAWLKIHPQEKEDEAVIFHTDDSRYVLRLGLQSSEKTGKYISILVARAGGNRRVLNTYYGTSSFPEVSTYKVQEKSGTGYPFPPKEWHLVTMTWDGYPIGKVRLYIDENMIGEHEYNSNYDDGRNLPRNISIGFRPSDWAGELVLGQSGMITDSRPTSTMSTDQAGVEIRDMRLYQRALQQQEIQRIIEQNKHKLIS